MGDGPNAWWNYYFRHRLTSGWWLVQVFSRSLGAYFVHSVIRVMNLVFSLKNKVSTHVWLDHLNNDYYTLSAVKRTVQFSRLRYGNSRNLSLKILRSLVEPINWQRNVAFSSAQLVKYALHRGAQSIERTRGQVRQQPVLFPFFPDFPVSFGNYALNRGSFWAAKKPAWKPNEPLTRWFATNDEFFKCTLRSRSLRSESKVGIRPAIALYLNWSGITTSEACERMQSTSSACCVVTHENHLIISEFCYRTAPTALWHHTPVPHCANSLWKAILWSIQ